MPSPSATRLPVAVLLLLALTGCGYVHEELPPGIEGGGVIDIRAPGEDGAAGATADPATLTSPLRAGSEDAASEATDSSVSRAAQAPSGQPVDWDALRAAALPVEGDPPSPSTAYAAQVEDAILTLLAERSSDSDAEAVVAALSQQLALGEDSLRGANPTTVRLNDVTGDGEADFVVGVPSPKLPLLVFQAVDGGYVPHRLPSYWPAEADFGAQPQLEATADMNSDGLADIIYTLFTVGASATTTQLHVAVWGSSGFDDVFTASLNDWAGPAPSRELWSLTEREGDVALRTECAAFGPFDAKLLSHPTLTRWYGWVDEAHSLLLVDQAAEPPTSSRQAANVAELALRVGDLASAAEWYEAVQTGAYSLEDIEVDWEELATFRLGLLYAMSDRSAQARIAMGNVLSGGGPLAASAGRFIDAYAEPDDAPRALAAATAPGDLAEATFEGADGGLPFPLTVDEVLWPGFALADWIHRRGTSALGEEPAETLEIDLGLTVVGAVAADLDTDDKDELLAVLERPTGAPDAEAMRSLWLVDVPPSGRPAAHMLLVGVEGLGDTVELSTGRPAVIVERGPLERVALGWEGGGASLHEPDPPYRLTGYVPEYDPRPGREACRVR